MAAEIRQRWNTEPRRRLVLCLVLKLGSPYVPSAAILTHSEDLCRPIVKHDTTPLDLAASDGEGFNSPHSFSNDRQGQTDALSARCLRNRINVTRAVAWRGK